MELEQMENELVVRGYGQRQIEAYMHYIELFFDFLPENEVNKEIVQEYIVFLGANGNNAARINSALLALKLYAKIILKKDLSSEIYDLQVENLLLLNNNDLADILQQQYAIAVIQ